MTLQDLTSALLSEGMSEHDVERILKASGTARSTRLGANKSAKARAKATKAADATADAATKTADAASTVGNIAGGIAKDAAVDNTIEQAAQSQTLKELGGKLWGGIKAHPGAAIGTGVLGATNLGTLFDNDKLLGQGVGTALGIAAPALIGKLSGTPLSIGKLGRVNLAMGGGALGGLFDILRAKQEQEREQAMMQQYGGSY